MIFNQMMQLRIDAQIAGKNVIGVKRASSAQPSCRGQHTAIRRAGRIAAVGRIATVVEDARAGLMLKRKWAALGRQAAGLSVATSGGCPEPPRVWAPRAIPFKAAVA
jgi:hypothetical protein